MASTRSRRHISSSEEEMEEHVPIESEENSKPYRRSARIHSKKQRTGHEESKCNEETGNSRVKNIHSHVETVHDNENSIPLDSNCTDSNLHDILKSLQELKTNTLVLHKMIEVKCKETVDGVSTSYSRFLSDSNNTLANIIKDFQRLEESGRHVITKSDLEIQGNSSADFQIEDSSMGEKNITPLKHRDIENTNTPSRSSERLQKKYATRSRKVVPCRDELFKDIDEQTAHTIDHAYKHANFKRRNTNNFVYG